MTFIYNNVYIDNSSTVAGPYEKDGNFGAYFDKTYSDLYFGEKSFELAEQKSVSDAIKILLKKAKLKKENIDLVLSGDLSNQITATSFSSLNIGKSYMGLYNACATSSEEIIVAS